MPSPEHFDRFGIFTRRGVLSDEQCDRACATLATALTGMGAVWNPHRGDHVTTEAKRRKELMGVAPELERLVEQALASRRDELSDTFSIELTRLQPLKFVRYDDGDHYRPHLDVSGDASVPELIRNRRVSVVLFLNDQVDDPEDGCYCGGRLTFHGLSDDRPWSEFGRPIDAEAGLMVAFLPDTLHEVTPVTWGTRYTVTTWWE